MVWDSVENAIDHDVPVVDIHNNIRRSRHIPTYTHGHVTFLGTIILGFVR